MKSNRKLIVTTMPRKIMLMALAFSLEPYDICHFYSRGDCETGEPLWMLSTNKW